MGKGGSIISRASVQVMHQFKIPYEFLDEAKASASSRSSRKNLHLKKDCSEKNVCVLIVEKIRFAIELQIKYYFSFCNLDSTQKQATFRSAKAIYYELFHGEIIVSQY